MKQTLEETLLTKVRGAKLDVQDSLFKEFCASTDDAQRADIGAMMRVLDKLTFKLTNSINGDK